MFEELKYKIMLGAAKSILKIYGLHVTYKDLTTSKDYNVVLTDVVITEKLGYEYKFKHLYININWQSISSFMCDMTFDIDGEKQFRLIVSQANSTGFYLLDISLEKIKMLLGDTILDNWKSEDEISIEINHNCIKYSGEIDIKELTDFKLTSDTISSALKNKNHISDDLSYEYADNVKECIKFAEDQQFDDHPGVCIPSIYAGILANQQENRIAFGASTITGQLLKNAFLSSEKSFHRKITEIVLALITEKFYEIPKEDILNLYMNMIEMAPDVYGIENGAQLYFGKSANELSEIELCVLTYIFPRPIHFYEALLLQTTKLKKNLAHHLSLYEHNDVTEIKFAPKFGTLELK